MTPKTIQTLISLSAVFAMFSLSASAVAKGTASEIGVVGIKWKCSPDSEYPVLGEISTGTPAEKAGLKLESKLIKLAGRDTRFLDDKSCRMLLTGSPGSTVNVTLKEPDGLIKNVTLKRIAIGKIANSITRNEYQDSYRHRGVILKDNLCRVPFLYKGRMLKNPVILVFYEKKSELKKIPPDFLKPMKYKNDNFPGIVAFYHPVKSQIGKCFNVKSAPTFVFMGTPAQTLREEKNIFRKKLNSEQINEHCLEIRSDSWVFQKRMSDYLKYGKVNIYDPNPLIPFRYRNLRDDIHRTEDATIRDKLNKRMH